MTNNAFLLELRSALPPRWRVSTVVVGSPTVHTISTFGKSTP